MMSHEEVTYSLTESVLHELNKQSTSLIAHECINLIDSFIKILTLDSRDVVASKDHNLYSMYGFESVK